MQRGFFLLRGPAFGGLCLRAERVLADEDGSSVLAAVDDARQTLAADERVLFLLGYEAAVELDPRAPRRRPDARLGPAAFAWRCRVASDADVDFIWPSSPSSPSARALSSLALSTTRSARDAHRARVAVAREQLLDGVIYQANLAHRLTVAPQSFEDGVAFFAARSAGVACAAFVDVPGWGTIVSLSPERFLVGNLATGDAWTHPIKGTTPRGADAAQDALLLAALVASEKDRAEHVMIVDLLRNDLGRVAVAGGVTVERLLAPLTAPNVHHLESTIHARLRPGLGMQELLAATAPGGSITGAPKSTAIETIHALEDGPRGAYTGVLGVVDGAGRFVTSLLIRTWLRPDDGAGALHVGGGIVVDSDPDAEWQETLHKARAFGEVAVREDPLGSSSSSS
jgi:anthranilate/para-aminobenzoate synthase component I